MESYLGLSDEELTACRKADLKRVRLGRFPFAGGIRYYVSRRILTMSKSTMIESEKKLRQMSREFEELKSSGAVGTTDPRHMQTCDVEAYLILLKRRGLKANTREKYVAVLKSYLRFWGNHVIDDMIARDGRILPKKKDTHIRTLSVDELERIFDAADKMTGYHGTIIRGVLALCFATGVRPKEFIDAELGDLDLDGMRFYVRHPKGEESWAEPQWIPIIRGDVVPLLEQYIVERQQISVETTHSLYLFFNPKTGDPYTLKQIREIKRKVEAASGVQFYLKDFRSTLASMTIEGNLSRLKPVSLQLRHTSVTTTEKYYARIREGEIEEAIGDVWKEHPIN